MGKYLLPSTFVLLLALTLGAYAFIVFELDGSTISTKHTVTPRDMQRR